MKWYYQDGGHRRGPVTDDELSALLAAGTITADTLVCREGLAGWEPLSKARPAEAAPASLSGPAGRPAQGPQQPEGAAGGKTATGTHADDGTLSEDEVLARDYQVPVLEAMTQALARLVAEPRALWVAGALVSLVSVGIGALLSAGPISRLTGVPAAAGAAMDVALDALGWLALAPLEGGLMLAYLNRIRGGDMGIKTAFQGYGPVYWRIVRALVVPALLGRLAFVPAKLLARLANVPLEALARPGLLDDLVAGQAMPPAAAPSTMLSYAVLVFAGLALSVYLAVSLRYTMPLVADRGYGVLAAMRLSQRMVARHFWQNLWLALVLGLIGGAGSLGFRAGNVIAGPVVAFAEAFAYGRLFKGLRRRQPESA